MKNDTSPDLYTLTVGLEIHAELNTQTKMFCACRNDADEKNPNANICPICMGHPGTLPVINKEAVRHVLRVGAAVGGELADFTEFDRKNYFYPDIPKGYQISQYEYPLVRGGVLSGVALTRIHLEEDTARSTHDKGSYSLVDFNRAGVPLMELVTEPVIRSAKDAAKFAEELQLLLRTLGAGEANMEKGEMRVEANISISKTDVFGTKVEVKNINSFKSVERAILYEVKRQTEILESGGSVVQETRGFNENSGTTFSQRKKENSHDYRYFPDPDLPKLMLKEFKGFSVAEIQATLPELPLAKRVRLNNFGIKDEDVEMLLRDSVLEKFVGELIDLLTERESLLLAVNYSTSDVAGIRKKIGDSLFNLITARHIADIVALVKKGQLSSRGAKEIITLIAAGEPGSSFDIAKTHSLIQESNTDAISKIVDEVVEANAKIVEEYRAGKEEAIRYLVGQGMKVSKGSANPQLLLELLQNRIAKK